MALHCPPAEGGLGLAPSRWQMDGFPAGPRLLGHLYTGEGGREGSCALGCEGLQVNHTRTHGAPLKLEVVYAFPSDACHQS
jgi:hypothetical protein